MIKSKFAYVIVFLVVAALGILIAAGITAHRQQHASQFEVIGQKMVTVELSAIWQADGTIYADVYDHDRKIIWRKRDLGIREFEGLDRLPRLVPVATLRTMVRLLNQPGRPEEARFPTLVNALRSTLPPK